MWTLRDRSVAAVVDPGEAQPVLDYLASEKLRLVAILATHHHQDHVGGIAELLRAHPVPVFGPRGEPIPTLTHPVGGGDPVAIPELGLAFEVLDIPGHTRAHIAYYGANMLFCGDTLFACGCGRAFEGTPQQLYASLQKLMALPDETLVYAGHEYTLANIGNSPRRSSPITPRSPSGRNSTRSCGATTSRRFPRPSAAKRRPTPSCASAARR